MDLDSPLEAMQRGWHRNARNIEFKGFKGDKRPQNIVGTTPMFSDLPSGNNVCIGRYFDEKNNNLYWFNYNSAGSNAIYVINIKTFVVATVIQDGINTNGIILGFDPNVTINSIDIIYGDPNTGDLLWWIDSQGRPSMLNIQQYLGLLPLTNPAYTNIKRGYIDVAKSPLRMAPKASYINVFTNPDGTPLSVNLLQNKLFQFRIRPMFDNFNKSVFGQPSEVPLPFQSSTQLTAQPVTSNSGILVYFPTGDVDVKRIELWVRIASDSNVSDWQLIYSFDKTVLAIPSNSIYQYTFFNNTPLTSGSIEEINQIHDYVPPKTNCGKIINGDTQMYGGITEGYPNPSINASISSTLANTSVNSAPGMLFFAAQGSYDSNGSGNQLVLYLTGAGSATNSVPYQNTVYTVDAIDNIGNSIKFTYSAGSVTSIPTILAGLEAAAIVKGFTFVSSTSNSVTLQFSPTYTLYGQTYIVPLSQIGSTAMFAYPYQLHNVYCIIYFDDKGVTMPGASLFLNNSFNTGLDLNSNNIPQNAITIRSAPPSDAKYYTIGRGVNSPGQLGWVSNQTFLNTDLNTGQQYVYIGISNMPVYDSEIEASTPVVKYDFAPGDRIQFLQRFPVGYPTNPGSALSLINNYPITSVEDDPLINGIIQQGSFIKFPYPTNDIGANFNFGADNFQNYQIIIVNEISEAAATNQIYYEYGRIFSIGNYGLSNPYHIGNQQTQLPDLSQPAIIIDNSGDYFRKQRIVPSGNVYYITILPFESATNTTAISATIPPSEVTGAPITNSQYTIANQTLRNASTWPPYSANDQIFWNDTANPVTLRFNGSFNFWTSKTGTLSVFLAIVNSSGPEITPNQLISNFSFSEPTGGAYQSYTINIDSELSIPPNTKIWVAYQFTSANGGTYTESYSGWTLFMQIVNPITITTIEPSFNDQYNIVFNSNGRPFAYDQDAATVFYGNKRRFSLAYQAETEINNTNRFYAENYDLDTKEFGDIVRMWLGPGKNLLIGQNKRIGIIGIYSKFIKNNDGQTQLVISDSIITKDNIQYYEFPFGLQDQPDCIIEYGYATYFYDVISGSLLRLSQDGIVDIGLEFKAQTWAGNTLPGYYAAAANSYAPGGKVKVFGTYHKKEHSNPEVLFVAQQGIGVSGDILAFDEKDNGFTSFRDGNYDQIICCGNQLFSWASGVLSIHNNTTTFSNYNGIQYYPSISHVFNDKTEFKKVFNTLGYDSNQIWEAFNVGDISTSLFSPESNLQQISQLIAQDFIVNEGRTFAALLRDANSQSNPILALLDGDFLRGVYALVKLTYRGSKSAYLHNPFLTYNLSPRNY